MKRRSFLKLITVPLMGLIPNISPAEYRLYRDRVGDDTKVLQEILDRDYAVIPPGDYYLSDTLYLRSGSKVVVHNCYFSTSPQRDGFYIERGCNYSFVSNQLMPRIGKGEAMGPNVAGVRFE